MTQTTRRTALRTTLGLAALALFALTGCGGGDGNVVAPVLTSTARSASNLELTVSLPKSTYARGEAVPFTMTVKNVSTQTVGVDYNSPSAYPLIKQGASLVWSSVSGVSSPRTTQLTPGQTLTFTGTWAQVNSSEAQVSAGNYTFQGWFDVAAVNGVVVGGVEQALSTFYTNPVSFTILP